MSSDPIPGRAFAGGALAVLALVLEFLGNVLGDAPSTSYPAWLVPIAWPTPIRTAWWVLAAVGAAAIGRASARVSGRSPTLRATLVAAPLTVFALGVAVGASWATWH